MVKLSIALAMGMIRLLSGSLEIFAAILMIYFNQAETALKINALLAIVGPTVMIVVTTLGVLGIADKVSLEKMLTILAGVTLIFIGLNRL